MKRIARTILVVPLIIGLLGIAPTARAQEEGRCPNGRSASGAMWMSVLHPGLGEYFLNGFGSWSENMPPRKFWRGFIPVFGWPGYLQLGLARDARQCKTTDGIGWRSSSRRRRWPLTAASADAKSDRRDGLVQTGLACFLLRVSIRG